ncbi:MAG: NADH-quinone oxidoreductase subunit M, partial [Candidatus Omnitrophica bacterium]|nr:NADH-quinone oxidoreductase subunit M [Candidatus Omnitrophota bacterium]
MILALPWIPLLGALAVLFVRADKIQILKRIVLITCGIDFLIVLLMFFTFQIGNPGFQFIHRFEWIPTLGISYQVGVDGISMTLCLLHALVSFAGAFVSSRVENRLKEYSF